MGVEELVYAIHIVELSATTRSSAIRELVDEVNWANENVLPEDVVKAIEEREARQRAGLASSDDRLDG